MSKDELERLLHAEQDLQRLNQRLTQALLEQIKQTTLRQDEVMQMLVAVIHHIELVDAGKQPLDVPMVLAGLRQAIATARRAREPSSISDG
ncbi:MAG: hypothetical protein AAFV29_19200, partial [Myxococcota bacterium]